MDEAKLTARATRYALQCALEFRSASADKWCSGVLKNISESGLLFHPSAHVGDEAQLEIKIDLPRPGIGSIWCTAAVVRRDAETRAIGARISEYRLLRQ